VEIDLVQGTDQTDQGLEIGQIDLDQGTGRIDQTDQGLEIVQVKGQVPEQGQVHDQAQVQDRVQEQDQVHDQVQWIDRGQDQVRDKVVPGPVVEVPWAATRVGVLHPGTVSAVDQVVLVNQEHAHHGVHRAEAEVEADRRAVVAVVAVAVAVAVDVDLKWP